MPDAVELTKAMKRAAVEAMNASKPVEVCFGKVTSTSPLKILVEQKLPLGEGQLVLCRNVTDHKTYITGGNIQNSLVGFLGFDLITVCIMFLAPHGLLSTWLAAGTFLLLCVGLLFYGGKMLKPMPKAWQNVLSVTVLPIAALAAFTGCAVLFETEILFLPAATPGNLLCMAVGSLYTGGGIDLIACALFAPLSLFLCMGIGAAVRGKAE